MKTNVRNSSIKKSSYVGFTLIELLVVISIIAILMVILFIAGAVFLVAAENEGLEAFIVENQADLVEQDEIEQTFREWLAVGYPVLPTSAREGRTIIARPSKP